MKGLWGRHREQGRGWAKIQRDPRWEEGGRQARPLWGAEEPTWRANQRAFGGGQRRLPLSHLACCSFLPPCLLSAFPCPLSTGLRSKPCWHQRRKGEIGNMRHFPLERTVVYPEDRKSENQITQKYREPNYLGTNFYVCSFIFLVVHSMSIDIQELLMMA